MSLSQGTRLGPLEVLSPLGAGGMGEVYRARDTRLGREVAVKVLSDEFSADADRRTRFEQEARAASALNHPNIVTIYDIGKSDRVAYMAMELLEGEELRSILSSHEPLPISEALDIGAQVAEGLAYAHERQIVHRDIKPANIMIVRDGLVKITDFGIARMRTNEVKTMTGMILGSPKYMSPEQVAGKRADHRSDLFSLGVLFYEMLTGEAPFLADSIHGIMYQIMHFTPPPPSSKNAELPDIVDLIVSKALAKAGDERYQSAKEFAHDLRDCHDTLMGKSSGPQAVSSASHASARRQDRLIAVKPRQAATEDEAKGLTLAKSFDSYEATMRLAALTGMDKDLETFSATQKMKRMQTTTAPIAASVRAEVPQPAASPASGTLRQPAKAAVVSSTKSRLPTYTYLWIVSAVTVVAAVALYLLR
jgi:serine/threonine-protein kinase